MISRRRRKLRIKRDDEIDAGANTGLHSPAVVAAQDYVMRRPNSNPWRAGTKQAKEYDTAYDLLDRGCQIGARYIQHKATTSPKENQ